MKPEDLRKAIAAKQHQPEVPNAIDYFSNPETQQVMLRFRQATNNICWTGDQIKQNVEAMLKAAEAAGIKFTGGITWSATTH